MSTNIQEQTILDCKGLLCPMPIIKLSQAIQFVAIGQTLEMTATDPGSLYDVQAWAHQTGNELVTSAKEGKVFTYIVRRAR